MNSLGTKIDQQNQVTQEISKTLNSLLTDPGTPTSIALANVLKSIERKGLEGNTAQGTTHNKTENSKTMINNKNQDIQRNLKTLNTLFSGNSTSSELNKLLALIKQKVLESKATKGTSYFKTKTSRTKTTKKNEATQNISRVTKPLFSGSNTTTNSSLNKLLTSVKQKVLEGNTTKEKYNFGKNNSETIMKVRNQATQGGSKTPNNILRGPYILSSSTPNLVNSVKQEIVECFVTKEMPRKETKNAGAKINENILANQGILKTSNFDLRGSFILTSSSPDPVNPINQEIFEDIIPKEKSKYADTKIDEKIYATQGIPNIPNIVFSNSSTSISSTPNLSSSIKQAIFDDVATKEIPEEKTNNFETIVDNLSLFSQNKIHISNPSSEIPVDSSISEISRRTSECFLHGSSKMSVKSVEKVNTRTIIELPSSLVKDDDSTLSLEEYSQQDGDDTLLIAQSDLSSSQEELASDTRARENSVPVHSVIEALTCSMCRAWAHSSKVFWCECRVICRSCKKHVLNTTCKLCDTSFAADARLVNFHMRVTSNVHHPCRYQGCSHIVKPGVAHEDTCQYVPTKCFMCKKYVPTARLRQHFDTVHSNQVLTDKNCDVKFSDFAIDDQSSDRRPIFCFTHGLLVSITLRLGDEWEFVVVAPDLKYPSHNITVIFEFKFNSYAFKKEATVRNDVEEGLKIINLPLDIFKDWNDGKCKLDINIVVKKRRIEENKCPQKKRKISTEVFDGDS